MALYEIFAVLYLIWTGFIFFSYTEKTLNKYLKGKDMKKIFRDKDDSSAISAGIVLVILGIGSWLITVLMMIWTAKIGIIFAKYYLFIFMGYVILSFVIASFRKKTIFKELSLKSKIFRYVTTWTEIAIILYALFVII